MGTKGRRIVFLLVRDVALFFILFYQRSLSSVFGGTCRFHPSCSQYALEAYQLHNPFRATILMAYRLSKCRPGGPYGVDMVPKPPPSGVPYGC